MKNRRISKISILLLALILVFSVSAQSTIAYLIDETGEITNTFKPIKTPVHDIDIKIHGEKKIDGREWNDSDGYNIIVKKNVDDTATAKIEWETVGNASVSKEQTTFDFTEQIKEVITAAGEYHFSFMEEQETAEDMIYDDSLYEVKITVVADSEGNLSVGAVTVVKGTIDDPAEEFTLVQANDEGMYEISMEFVNVYEEDEESTDPIDPTDPSQPSDPSDPTDPTDPSQPGEDPTEEFTDSTEPIDDNSKTGDDSNLILPLALMIASGVLIAALLFDRRRRNA